MNYYKHGIQVGAGEPSIFDSMKETIRKEAADGATKAVTPMVLGVGAIASVALLVALVK